MSASEIGKSYGVDVILEDVSFSVNKGDRIGIVGPNGAGKTTLLSILSGEAGPTTGNFYVRNGYTVGYLKQRNHFFSEGTVLREAEKTFTRFHEMEKEIHRLEEAISDHEHPDFNRNLEQYTALMEKYKEQGGYTYKSELKSVLRNMGFGESEYDKKISMLSGGERTRLAMACMLLKQPDILMLDEPTNHLDLRMLEWLEQYLKAYKGTIIVVSHDRYFLDQLVNRIFEVSQCHLTDYRGNYSEYLIKHEERMEVALREYEKQQKEIEKQEEIIRRFKGHGTEKLVNRAKSREKRLAHMEVKDRPVLENNRMKLTFHSEYKSGNDVMLAEDLEKSFGERKLFDYVSFDIKKGERICIIGDNGVGKTTLLRILMGKEQADRGYLKIGHNVNFGYYDQGQLLLDENETVLGEMKNAYHLYTDTEMRSILGRFLFRGDDVFKQIRSLSGGEKAKLSLLKLMLSGANTLILDEPTNHLDIDAKEVVEDALLDFEGTLIIVSHDRYLLQKLPTRIFELTTDGIVEYKGRFDYYLQKKEELKAAESSEEESKSAPTGELSAEEERKLRKEQEAEQRRQERRIKELEGIIEDLEAKIQETEEILCAPENMSNVELLQEKGELLEQYKADLEVQYEEWMELQ
ncbi:ABC-F family ATP-binding cassette domain-containing protein [Mogibacterium sp.]|uniref:ABC-F family ATP-binding cassette domain-containing protein n=1 Tax=Mogibacterium sp. TaxID=2049035 RepID=UPI0025DF7A32|nr:ABC-F family ATP-binding cassette domain-containing protein [Mogibacterium sp.]